ncbi:MAG: type II toxin-antitoxin system VapC family toxin [Gemmataceae bacterium]
MILLDTDHVSVLKYRTGDRYTALAGRLADANEPYGTTIVTVEEQMRGWMSAIAKERLVARQVTAYRELGQLFSFYAKLALAAFDEAAAARFDELRAGGVRVASMDLKIAAITLVQGARLLTANRKDFEKVPGLRFENWLD